MTAASKPLVIFYSRTGHARRVADTVARRAGADLCAIETRRYAPAFLWLFRAIGDALRHADVEIAQLPDPSNPARPWIAACGPVWAGHPAPPLRAALLAMRGSEIPVGLVLTFGGSGNADRAEETAEAALGRPLAARCRIEDAVAGADRIEARIDPFLSRMRAAAADRVA